MIPKFKTYLEESVWGDIRKKSLGQEKRVEDDVDLMSPDAFYEYLNDKYTFEILDLEKKHRLSGVFEECIRIPISSDTKSPKLVCLFYDNFKHQAYILSNSVQYIPELYDKIRDNFKITIYDPTHSYIHIEPLEGESCNSFCLKLIDFMIDNLDTTHKCIIHKNVFESVWGDIRKKSLGQEERKEDNVNDLSPKDMYYYLKKTYEPTLPNPKYADTITYMANGNNLDIDIPLYDSCSLRVSYTTYTSKIKMKLQLFFSTFKVSDDVIMSNRRMIDALRMRYRVEEKYGYQYIRPNTGKKTNRLVIDLIDFILNKTENEPKLKKI